MEVLKIPHERIKILLGENGATKKELEKKCKVTLIIGHEGEVQVEGETADVYFAKDVVKAIGRGFQPQDALKLITENYVFFLFDLKEHLPTDKAITRIKGRVIGKDGRMKTEIEAATESVISVFGSTIGIITKIDSMEFAKNAVLKIINGAEHSSVYSYLTTIRQDILRSRLLP